MLILQILGMITQFEPALIIERIKVGAGGRTNAGAGSKGNPALRTGDPAVIGKSTAIGEQTHLAAC
jgi:hypothetical protein